MPKRRSSCQVPVDGDALAGLEVADQPDEHDLVALALDLDDAEAGVGRGEAHAVDDDLVGEARARLTLHVPTLGAGRPEWLSRGSGPSRSRRRRPR